MNEADFGRWQDMASAPRDGTRVLVLLRASEQGPAEVDMVRWARPDRQADECWLSTDSDPALPVIYTDAELASWMPLPNPLPRLRGAAAARPHPAEPDEAGGSGI